MVGNPNPMLSPFKVASKRLYQRLLMKQFIYTARVVPMLMFTPRVRWFILIRALNDTLMLGFGEPTLIYHLLSLSNGLGQWIIAFMLVSQPYRDGIDMLFLIILDDQLFYLSK